MRLHLRRNYSCGHVKDEGSVYMERNRGYGFSTSAKIVLRREQDGLICDLYANYPFKLATGSKQAKSGKKYNLDKELERLLMLDSKKGTMEIRSEKTAKRMSYRQRRKKHRSRNGQSKVV